MINKLTYKQFYVLAVFFPILIPYSCYIAYSSLTSMGVGLVLQALVGFILLKVRFKPNNNSK